MKSLLSVLALTTALAESHGLITLSASNPESIGIVSGVPGRLTLLSGSTVWPAGSRVSLRGAVIVSENASLTIERGVTIEAEDGSSLIVARNARLSVSGSQNEPVVLTCSNNAKVPGCWDGLTILGNAPINHGTLTSPAGGRGGAGGCRESTLDGAPYGGCTADDSSGVLQFVRIQYATHGLRIYGVGSKTILRDVQVHRSTGHGLDVVGGTAQFRHLALTTNSQYGMTYSGGWTGQAQYVVIQQDATGYAGGLLGRNAVGAGGDQNAAPRSAPVLANFTIVTPPSAVGNPYGSASPAAVRFDRGAAGKLYNMLLIQPGIGVDVDDAATCTQLASNALTMQGVGVTAPVAATDPDTDPAACATQGEASLLTGATTVTGVAATAQLQSATNVVLPDLRPVANSIIATAVGVAPTASGLVEAVTYLGALRVATSGVIPWYSGWTLGESLAAPALVTLEGVVNALGRGGVAGVVVQVAPVGLTATTNALGRFVVSGVPAGPVEVSFVSGVPTDCQTPAVVRAVASGGTTTLADAVLICSTTSPVLDKRSIVAGIEHSCALTTSGVAYCWGKNGSGQLGNGTAISSQSSAQMVIGQQRFVTLAAGGFFNCGLTSTGAAYCWGHNLYGELGNGTATQQLSPAPVSGGLVFTLLEAGPYYACGLTQSGQTYCWGFVYNGQVGDGTPTPQLAPTLISGGPGFVALAAGTGHTCGLSSSGAAYCWGSNQVGQLGDGTISDKISPTRVSGEHIFVILVAGDNHTCGLTASGAAYCWGANSAGEVGDGTTTTRRSPTLVGAGPAFVALAAANAHTCALTGAGSAYCWGVNTVGQLGDGTKSQRLSPTPVSGGQTFVALESGGSHSCALTNAGEAYCWGDNLGKAPRPYPTLLVGGAPALSRLYAGNWHTCGLTTAGAAYCWGEGSFGQLGIGFSSSSQGPTMVVGGLSFSTLATGAWYTCGVANGAAAYCWGANSYGQLGDGSTDFSRDAPTPVVGGLTFKSLGSGEGHTCGVATSGAAYCWGVNDGRLGYGAPSAATRLPPTPVSGEQLFIAIEAGVVHTCGLTTAGEIFCWGNNVHGELGDGTTELRYTPTLSAGNRAYVSLVTGWTSTCGLTSAGTAYCWGENNEGQLGDGTTTQRPSPTPVSGGLAFSVLAAGAAHTCGLTNAGTAYCWGVNFAGQLGDESTTDRRVPTLVSGGRSFVALTAGVGHTCGLTSAGSVYCWGDNQYGQLSPEGGVPSLVLGNIVFRTP